MLSCEQDLKIMKCSLKRGVSILTIALGPKCETSLCKPERQSVLGVWGNGSGEVVVRGGDSHGDPTI